MPAEISGFAASQDLHCWEVGAGSSAPALAAWVGARLAAHEAALAALLAALDCPNVGVNFDPANLILYGQGDPVAAVLRLGSSLKQVHIKDARHTQVPGTWGEEVVAGTGDVDWPEFFRALHSVNFTGDLVIEREAGGQRVADVCAAREIIVGLAD